jgi:hypothetical protein
MGMFCVLIDYGGGFMVYTAVETHLYSSVYINSSSIKLIRVHIHTPLPTRVQ